jgi:8-oxo-dGTP pyrophosphatase MutT (NUDIX family)
MPHIHELYDFTVSAFVQHPTEKKLLMIKHKKLGVWLQPGGHVELDEHPLETLYHELEEETGLKPSDYEILEPADHPQTSRTNISLPLPFNFHYHNFNETHRHIDLEYLVHAKTAAHTDDPDGASDIQWLGHEELRRLQKAGELYDDVLTICEWLFEHKF